MQHITIVEFLKPYRGHHILFRDSKGKHSWEIEAKNKTEFQNKLRKLRKTLGINRAIITISDDWNGFNN